jgi:hypothetical protein
MRKFLLAVLMMASFSAANSQQLHFMSQYMQHNSMYNPAAAGMSSNDKIGFSYRNMWSSFPGHPKTTMIYGDFDLKKLNAGLASYLYRDETGPTSRTGVQLAYSYHIKARNNKSKFGIGLELRGLQYKIDQSKLNFVAEEPVTGGTKFVVDAGAGLYWTNSKLSVGAAVSQLIQSKLKFADVPGVQQEGKLYRHYNFTANYRILTEDGISIIPNAMFRMIENSPSEFDFGVKTDYQDKFWWAINFRVHQFWSVQAGLRLSNKLTACYSYDYYVAPIGVFVGGSGAHEIGIQFDIKKN